MAYRFVHAADIHLDSPLKSLALRDAALADLIGNATRQAFTRIIDICLAEQVDALLLAGDLYDGDQTSMMTARFLAEQMRRLDAASIRTFVIRGNHDAESKITRELTLPPSVHVFDHRGEAVPLRAGSGGLDVVVHGLSFKDPKASESLLPRYRPPVDDATNIGLMHTSLGGTEPHNPYAPCALADLHGSGFQYWALGHIHIRSEASGGRGRDAAVVMPGIPQGRDIGEAGPKSVSLVTVGDDRSISVEERLTSVAQFERVRIDLGGVEDWRAALAGIEARLGRARDETVSDHLVARLVVTGATTLAARLRRDADLLREEVAMRAAALGRVSIDKVELGVTEPREAVAGGDLFAELRRLVTGDVLTSPDFRSALADLADDLSKKLPLECRDAVFGAAGTEGETLARLAAEGASEVLERLRDVAASQA